MKKKFLKQLPILSALMVGVVCCIATSVLLLLLCTALVNNGSIELTTGSGLVVLIQGVSVFVGSAVAGMLAGEGRKAVSALTAASYLIISIIIALLFMGGIGSQLLWGAVAVFCGLAIEILISTRKINPKRKKAKSHFR